MKLDLSKFKKIKEDKASATLKHPAGHHIVLNKDSLMSEQKDSLAGLPLHLEEGGDVSDDQTQDKVEQPEQGAPAQNPNQPTIVINNTPPPQNPIAQMPAYNPQAAAYNLLTDPSLGAKAKDAVAEKQGLQVSEQNPLGQTSDVLPQTGGRLPTDVQPSSVQPEKQAAEKMEAPSGIPGAAPNQGLQQQMGGLQAEAGALGQQGKMAAEAYQSHIDQTQKDLSDFQQSWQTLAKERQSFVQDLQNQHIDPNHLLNSQGAGGKMMTAIGLMLGGMGGGLTHQENPALKFLMSQIDNDIRSQQMNLNKSDSLLRANMENFKNLDLATSMTRVMKMEMLSNKIGEISAQTQEPLAKARAQQAIGQIRSTIDQQMNQMALQRSVMERMGSVAGSQAPQNSGYSTPVKLSMMKRSGLIDAKEYEAGLKEAKESDELMKARDNALKAFDQINSMNTIGNRVMSPLQTSKRVNALRDNLAVQLARDAAGRVNEYEFKAAKDLFPAPGDDEETVKAKRAAVVDFANKKASFPALDALGLGVKAKGIYNERGANRFQEGAPVLK